MTLKRILTQMRFFMYLGNGRKRAEYAKKKGIYAQIGENSSIPIPLPLYPELVKIHDNVSIHRSVKLVTHDVINNFLSRLPDAHTFKNTEGLKPIEIYDNVFIGMDTIILGNVSIGPNAIINSGSVITSNVPPNSIVEGNPAKVVGSFDMYVRSRILMDNIAKYEFKRSGKESIDKATAELAWEQFDKKRNREIRKAEKAEIESSK